MPSTHFSTRCLPFPVFFFFLFGARWLLEALWLAWRNGLLGRIGALLCGVVGSALRGARLPQSGAIASRMCTTSIRSHVVSTVTVGLEQSFDVSVTTRIYAGIFPEFLQLGTFLDAA